MCTDGSNKSSVLKTQDLISTHFGSVTYKGMSRERKEVCGNVIKCFNISGVHVTQMLQMVFG